MAKVVALGKLVRMVRTGKMGKMAATEAEAGVVIGDVAEMVAMEEIAINALHTDHRYAASVPWILKTRDGKSQLRLE